MRASETVFMSSLSSWPRLKEVKLPGTWSGACNLRTEDERGNIFYETIVLPLPGVMDDALRRLRCRGVKIGYMHNKESDFLNL